MSKGEEELQYEILSEEFNDYDLSFKIIIVGDSGVGKSCLTMRGTKNNFEDFYTPTVGFEFVSFNVRIEDKNIKLQIWDTCGQEVYRSLISSFYRSASLAIMVYSIDNDDSFNNIEKWLNDVKTQSNPNIKIFLIGNKADLEDKRKVSREAGEKFLKDHKLTYFIETSAKTGFNVQNVFIQAAKELYLSHEEIKNRVTRPGSLMNLPVNNETSNVLKLETEDEEIKKKKKFCCF